MNSDQLLNDHQAIINKWFSDWMKAHKKHVKNLPILQDRAASNVNVTGTDRKIDAPLTDPCSLDVHGERREGEGMTEFTMRKIRNEIIEECAQSARKAWPIGAYPLASENSDVYRGQDHAAQTIVKAIRGLKR